MSLAPRRRRAPREIGEALDSITAETALLLVIEDLHWVDDSTVDLISTVARRRARAKLMLLGTCRPLDPGPSGHALKALLPDSDRLPSVAGAWLRRTGQG